MVKTRNNVETKKRPFGASRVSIRETTRRLNTTRWGYLCRNQVQSRSLRSRLLSRSFHLRLPTRVS